jgi:hypothetical protein
VQERKVVSASEGANEISLSEFVLAALEQVRADPGLASVSVESVTISIPYRVDANRPPVHWPSQPLRLAEVRGFLKSHERAVVLTRERLSGLPDSAITRVTLTVRFSESEAVEEE